MQRGEIRRLVVACGFAWLTSAANAGSLGDAILEQGGSKTLVNAGNAIQSTCKSLAMAGGTSLAGPQQDLFFRCNEMVTTFALGPPNNPTANSYGYVDPNNQNNAVRQFSGEEASSQRRLGKSGSNAQFTGVGARMDAIRRGARSTTSGLAMNLDGINLLAKPDEGATGFPQIGGAAGDAGDADIGWAWFGNVNGGYSDRDRSPNEDGYDSNFYGGTLGVDYAFDSGMVLGIAVGYQDYTADVTGGSPTAANPASPSSGGSVDATTYSFSGYALFNTDAYFMSAIVGYASSDYDLDRKAFFLPGPNPQGRAAAPGFMINRSYRANTDSGQAGAELTFGGAVIEDGPFSLDAYVKLNYLAMHIDGYTEKERDNTGSTSTPGLALKYVGQDVDVAETGLGFTMRRSFNTGFGVFVPYLGAEWRYQYNGGNGVVKYSYAFALPAQPGDDLNFASRTDNSDKSYSIATVGFSTQFAHNVSAFLQYEALLGLNNISSGVGTIGLRGTF